MRTLCLIIRGYENNTLKNKKIYNLLKILYKHFNIDIYIHTYKFNNNESWRKYSKKELLESDIKYYFNEYNSNIKNIIIDDNNPNIWEGQYKIINQIINKDDYFFIINVSFDALENNFNDIIIQILNLSKNEQIKKIYFTKAKCYTGLDNCYFGDYNSMNKFIDKMYNNYNDLLNKYNDYNLMVWSESKNIL